MRILEIRQGNFWGGTKENLGRGQRAEGREQRAEGREQKVKGGEQRAEIESSVTIFPVSSGFKILQPTQNPEKLPG